MRNSPSTSRHPVTHQMWGWIDLDFVNIGVSVVHFAQGLLTLYIGLSKKDEVDWMFKGKFGLVEQYPQWHNGSFVPGVSEGFEYVGNDKYHITLDTTSVGYFDVRWAVPSFFFMSFLFQATASLIPRMEWAGDTSFTKWNPIVRYIEYSFSGTLVLLCIAVESGVCQWMTLFCMAILSFVTMLLGLIADFTFILGSEQVRKGVNTEYHSVNLWMWVFPHVLSWVSCVASYFPIAYTFGTSITSSDLKPPVFVYVIVLLEAFLFFCFGFVQTYELWVSSLCVQDAASKAKGKKVDDPTQPLMGNTEVVSEDEENTHKFSVFMYILLSAVAKTLLGWLIFGPIMAGR